MHLPIVIFCSQFFPRPRLVELHHVACTWLLISFGIFSVLPRTEGEGDRYALLQGGLFSCGRQENKELPLEPKLNNSKGAVSLITVSFLNCLTSWDGWMKVALNVNQFTADAHEVLIWFCIWWSRGQVNSSLALKTTLSGMAASLCGARFFSSHCLLSWSCVRCCCIGNGWQSLQLIIRDVF